MTLATVSQWMLHQWTSGVIVLALLATMGIAQETKAAIKTPVVVELFTSEGCSSCPPADELAGKLVQDGSVAGRPVIVLAFHVDYWNHLGWVDPYSQAAFSDRQQDYARALGLNEIYTPQIIIGGSYQCIGSDQQAVQSGIAAAGVATVQVNLNIKEGKTIGVRLVGDCDGCILNLAVVERGLVSHVKNGENGGRTLVHQNVVRWFDRIKFSRNWEGEATIPSLTGVNFARASVIGFVQRPGPGPVIGAAEAGFISLDAK